MRRKASALSRRIGGAAGSRGANGYRLRPAPSRGGGLSASRSAPPHPLWYARLRASPAFCALPPFGRSARRARCSGSRRPPPRALRRVPVSLRLAGVGSPRRCGFAAPLRASSFGAGGFCPLVPWCLFLPFPPPCFVAPRPFCGASAAFFRASPSFCEQGRLCRGVVPRSNLA